ncbi:4132_t:CDS:2 [Dentiscutata erythropus]|uniref:4132_t:CDS:1 n=2 Tax=Gigasporaceae TaxID=36753 RepID=A0A9N9NB77_9GLOM|nr:4132_t:CDS:2 [Dentiscutata erythropus]
MADAANTKLRYYRGTCFGCRKCLYCAVDLRNTTCKCKLSLVPTKKNRTDLMKQAYTRIFEPTWVAPMYEYIYGKVMEYNYQINVKKTFRFSLCGRCHNVLVKLNSKAKKKKTTRSPSPSISVAASEDRINENEMSSEEDDESEFALAYKLFVKTADGISLPAKWFQESVSTVDEFLSSVHNKIHLMTKDNTIMPSDYFVTFKTQRETGAGTQLVDEQDFIKFKSEYTKLAARKSDIGIYVTISQPSITSQNKQKKKESDLGEHEENTERSNNYKNNNRVPSVSSLSAQDKEIAKNNKGLATVENPPTHPLFSYASLSSKKLCSKLPSTSSPQMPLVLPPSLSPQVQPLSPDVQLSQSPQAQLMQLQQSLPQVQPQVQLSQQLPYQVQQSPQAQLMQPPSQVQLLQQSLSQVQKSPQAQLMQPPQIRLPQQSLPLSQVQQSPQMQLLQQSPPLSQVQLLQPLPQGHPQLILSPFSLQQSFLPSLSAPQYNWAFGAQQFQSHQPTLYNPYQTLPHISTQSHTIQSNPYVSFTLPTMAEFLKEVDEGEETGDHYQSFLEKFNAQRILVKRLKRLTDEEFALCGVETIGERQTLREYVEKYQKL